MSQRDGLRLHEVYSISNAVKRAIETELDPNEAFADACRGVRGVKPETFKKWKDDIFKLARGEKTALDSALPVAVKASGPAAQIAKLQDTSDALQAANEIQKAEIERLKAELAKKK